MIFHYAGKYDGDKSKLPCREHHPQAVPFREPEDMKKLSLVVNIGGVLLMVVLAIPFLLRGRPFFADYAMGLFPAGLCACLTLFPHELLHAVCFKEDVYMYNDLAHGLMFVIGTEDMSKGRFIFMSLCPNIVFGLIPYVIFLLFPNLIGLGFFGIVCLSMGCGDYLNVYNAIRQMPSNSKTYLHGMHSYWYPLD